MKQKIIEFFKGLGTILLFFILSLVGALIFHKYYYSDNILIATLSQLGSYSLIFIILTLIYHKRLINDFKNFKKEYLNLALRNYIIGLSIMIISNIIISNFTKNIPVNESINRDLLLNFPISNIITMTIIGPILEEITFRASFKKAFNNCYLFCFVTALLFGLAHIADFKLLEFLFVIPYGALGFFFAKAFYETDNIYSSIFIHMLHNTLSIILIFLL